MTSVPELISKIQNLSIAFRAPAKVIINERTGTIVMGGDVKLSPVAVLHGNLTVEVTTDFTVSQPNGFSKGETTVVPQTSVKAADSPARKIELAEGANVQQLIAGLQSIGATARDIVAIIQAIKAAGGLQAELEVL
jgi:flagellar P-ring protein precursor FlgI